MSDKSPQAEKASQSAKKNVFEYYKATTEDYLKYYDTSWHQHMHYGFDRDLPKGGNPTENLVKYMGEKVSIQPGEKVLDAGCGVGGSLFWLAANLGIQGVGLNYMHMQCALAAGFGVKRGLQEKVHFCNGDFMHPPFAPESFDVVWAIESSDHAPDKKQWAENMFKLLKPGGRLIVADGFKAEREFSPKEEKMYQKFLRGWAVPHLAERNEFMGYMEQAGFEKVACEDITPDVLPHAFAIWRFGLIFVPIRTVLNKIGLCSREKLGNALATLHQYPAIKKKLWTYEIMTGYKSR
jgi:cyclopropane fatty-acyl-phospholipid synthase-like methyltransferase